MYQLLNLLAQTYFIKILLQKKFSDVRKNEIFISKLVKTYLINIINE